jgi:hypothetical protein
MTARFSETNMPTPSRAPRRTEREKFEDYFFDQHPERQEKLLEDLRRLMRIKARQLSEAGTSEEAEPIAEHDAGGENFEGATQ